MRTSITITLMLVVCLVGYITCVEAQEIELPLRPLSNPVTQLRIESHDYAEYRAREWQLRLAASQDQEQPLLENLLSADFEVVFPHSDPLQLHWNMGSHAEATDFKPMAQRLTVGQTLLLESFGGRSSDGVLPYFNLAGQGGGLIMAIGWSGDWQATFLRQSTGGVQITAGLKRSRFRLQPGEVVRLPSILVMAYRGDWLNGQNQFRRLMLEHFTPGNHSPMSLMPVAASVHGMLGFNDTSQEQLLRLVDDVAAAKLPLDTFWLDAGWNEGGFAAGQGNWQADPVRFPTGLRAVGEAVQRQGWRFLVWFEPERVMRGTWLDRQHPEWMLRPSATPTELRYQENDGFKLLDFGHAAARKFAIETISEQIKATNLGVYRHDCNAYPAYFWHTDEGHDDVGLREVRYITGLYDYLDELARRHPDLILDHCASGGRRLDFEMLRRCVCLWRSDSCWDDASYPRNVQCMTLGLSQWLPLHGLGALGTDSVSLRSGMGVCASFAINFRDLESVERLRKHLQLYLPNRRLYTRNFYPLTAWSANPQQWLALEFFDPDTGEGIVQAFCGDNPEPRTEHFRLAGLDPTVTYALRNWDQPDQETFVNGAQLMTAGLAVTASKGQQAVVFTFRSR